MQTRTIRTARFTPRVTDRSRAARGFTLIELLVVLGVIGILVTLSITVGFRVLEGGKERVARDTMRLLDNALTTWTTDKESKFPSYLEGEPTSFVPGGPERPNKYAIIDGVDRDSGRLTPTLAMFLVIARQSPSVETMVKQQLDPKYLATSPPVFGSEGITNIEWDGLTIADPWGRAYRFVHPAWHGGYGEFVIPPESGGGTGNRSPRTVPNGTNTSTYDFIRSYSYDDPRFEGKESADEGLCPGSRPYFYSAGPDGDAGTRGDNIYLETARPSFPPETSKYNIE